MQLTKEQAYSIETFLKHSEGNKEKLLSLHANKINTKQGWKTVVYSPINDLSLEQLAIALYVGYEVVMTSHDKIIELYKNLEIGRHSHYSLIKQIACDESIQVLLKVLDILGEKVEGIN